MFLNGFRLSLSNEPITETGTLPPFTYEVSLVPYHHGMISLWNGRHWQVCTSAQRITLNFIDNFGHFFRDITDVFAYMDPSDNSIHLDTSPIWSGFPQVRSWPLEQWEGVWVKRGDPTRLYVGTVQCTSDFAITDSETWRSCWNMYNRVPRSLFYAPDDTTNSSWLYNSTTVRQRGGNQFSEVRYVVGMPTLFRAEIYNDLTSPAGSGLLAITGVGADESSTTISSGSYYVGGFADQYTAGVGMSQMGVSTYSGIQSVGERVMCWNERTVGAFSYQQHNNHNLVGSSVRAHMRAYIMG